MKLKRLHIENFRCIRTLDIPFCLPYPPHEPRPLTAIVGDNGSGKTTVLQAIALTLSLATKKTADVRHFDWKGFRSERVSSLGKTKVEAEVLFEEDESRRAEAICQADNSRFGHPYETAAARLPLASSTGQPLRKVGIVFDGDDVCSPRGKVMLELFKGRSNISRLHGSVAPPRDALRKFGDVFWFDQYRDLSVVRVKNGPAEHGEVTWKEGVLALRQFMLSQWQVHKAPDKGNACDYIPELERRFAEIFPGTTFVGTRPFENVAEPGLSDYYFLLEREGKRFDISEMSSGEQAVFVMLLEFVRQNIARSVVLIDELELHLHPPQQQALISALPKIGPDCQFIITTHSPDLEGSIPREQVVRLPGGRPCL